MDLEEFKLQINEIDSQEYFNKFEVYKNYIIALIGNKIKIFKNLILYKTFNDSMYNCILIYNNLLISGSNKGNVDFFDIDNDFNNIKTININNYSINCFVIFYDFLVLNSLDGSISFMNLKDNFNIYQTIYAYNTNFLKIYKKNLIINEGKMIKILDLEEIYESHKNKKRIYNIKTIKTIKGNKKEIRFLEIYKDNIICVIGRRIISYDINYNFFKKILYNINLTGFNIYKDYFICTTNSIINIFEFNNYLDLKESLYEKKVKSIGVSNGLLIYCTNKFKLKFFCSLKKFENFGLDFKNHIFKDSIFKNYILNLETNNIKNQNLIENLEKKNKDFDNELENLKNVNEINNELNLKKESNEKLLKEIIDENNILKKELISLNENNLTTINFLLNENKNLKNKIKNIKENKNLNDFNNNDSLNNKEIIKKDMLIKSLKNENNKLKYEFKVKEYELLNQINNFYNKKNLKIKEINNDYNFLKENDIELKNKLKNFSYNNNSNDLSKIHIGSNSNIDNYI